MRTEVRLHASAAHQVIFYPETDAEKKVLEILDGRYQADVAIHRAQGAYHYERRDAEIQSVVISIERVPDPPPEPPDFAKHLGT